MIHFHADFNAGATSTFIVSGSDALDLLDAPGAEDLDQDGFIRPGALHGFVEGGGAVVGRGHHQAQDEVLKVPAELAL